MSTKLASGTVVPFGLLSPNGSETAVAAFNRSYKNTGIKAGLVKRSYAPTDPQNQNGLCTEYDVLTIEQNENKGSTSILYKNCLSTQGFGSIADYLEFTLRPLMKQDSKGFPTFSNQDGAIVLIQCLNNIGDKAIVVGTLIHPDRPTNVTSNAPQLYGEYNGVNIQINQDGSCSLIFKGTTDSQGIPTDSSQGNTEVKIEKDGSFQVDHSMVTFRMDKTTGNATINAKKDINLITNTNLNVTATADVKITCASATVTSSGKTVIKASEIDLNNPVSGITTANSHQNVIDFITGVPVQPSTTVLSDV
jgi:hypothetical protein